MITDNVTGRRCFVATCNVSPRFRDRSKKEPLGDDGLKPEGAKNGVSNAGK